MSKIITPYRSDKWQDWIAVFLSAKLNLGFFYKLYNRYRSIQSIITSSRSSIFSLPGVTKKQIDAFLKSLDNHEYRPEIEHITSSQISIISLSDSKYPEKLRHIYQPPPVLYCLGDFEPQDQNAVAIVGTRQATAYGKAVAEKIAGDLSKRGITIISGLARGIDQAAHKAALDNQARTIAVLGSGLHNIYPRKSDILVKQIHNQGVILSEFPLLQAPYKGNFPRRNRIISGLSLGVTVVEAPQKSGALITANFALEQGRDVFAVPGRITSRTSAGCNKLIQLGAKLVISANDIIEEIEQLINTECLPTQRKAVEHSVSLTDLARTVFQHLSDEPVHIDVLQRLTGLTPGKCASALLELEMEDLIKQLPGKIYIRNFMLE